MFAFGTACFILGVACGGLFVLYFIGRQVRDVEQSLAAIDKEIDGVLRR